MLVLGVGGTASMIRVMRANLLDELKRPYVTTARAKGVRPLKLLFKYPVRLALNPFVSGLGGLFPHLVSGGAIVALVLSLPMVGPVMLDAVLVEDVYLAGSMLMVLSLLHGTASGATSTAMSFSAPSRSSTRFRLTSLSPRPTRTASTTRSGTSCCQSSRLSRSG